MRRHLMLLLLFFLMPTVYGQTNIALNPNAPVIDPSNASQLALLAELELQGAQDVVWSPGGLRIAILSGSRVYLYSTQDMSASPTIIDTGATVKDMAFNPDGLLLAVATLDDRLRLFSVTNSTIFAERSVTAYDIAYSINIRHGRTVIVIHQDVAAFPLFYAYIFQAKILHICQSSQRNK